MLVPGLFSLGCMHDRHHAHGHSRKFFCSRGPPCQPSHDLRTQNSQPHRRGAMIQQSPLLRATGTITCGLTRPCCPALAAWILAKTPQRRVPLKNIGLIGAINPSTRPQWAPTASNTWRFRVLIHGSIAVVVTQLYGLEVELVRLEPAYRKGSKTVTSTWTSR